ncbi:MAG: bifunctional glutamate N-acetyltransferase/amino-acid acetyltransferase ArgJ [Synechococcus sp. SB0669_bin_7]|nr:bifunctional glutamate N-acetyltransferase/amino-acid acetyltransferase ArgJ [Synechococcus sp. SB0675_bin_7]MYK06691.1 bifunctional glutamate N-acetyltransferase/amino-acid acetyltransferase ArgJ [Synechococcus sp. SB0670_bin_20]MYK86835.1 bifunctional glutamate N-acetyltransferase/amino-acid acetyltransferase ArgJ [Synechococcus sp. SB0669_bin_7]
MGIVEDPCSWSPVAGGVTAPAGFQASGVAVGLKPSGARDLAVVVAPPGASCAGVFTRNQVRAACVDLCAERLRYTGGQARAVVVNAGQANACTGDLARVQSERITAALAQRLGCPPEQVQICSTGVIGRPLPMDRLLAGQAALTAELAATEEAAAAAAEAILTTDLVSKQYALETQIGNRMVRLGGMAKGSGMIHPDMATMLAFITCDAGVDPQWWQRTLQAAVDGSFNAVTVDGDTSTNDTVLAFAAGAPLATEHLPQLALGLECLCCDLARAIARDGEGATCLLEVTVSGTATAAEARTMARTICGSSLVKTAIHGRDPNWGRIVAAAGRSGVHLDPDALALWIGPHQVLKDGRPLAVDRAAVGRYLQRRAAGAYLQDDCVEIRLAVGAGPASGSAWGCDLSQEYIRINAHYTT